MRCWISDVCSSDLPGDFCFYSPDRPFGWDFNGACEGHDGCLLELPNAALLPDRLGCDDSFFEDLLQAPHLEMQRACEESPFRSEERRVGKAGISTVRSLWQTANNNKKQKH